MYTKRFRMVCWKKEDNAESVINKTIFGFIQKEKRGRRENVDVTLTKSLEIQGEGRGNCLP